MLFKILIFLIFFYWSNADDWHSKSQCTQKEFANHMEISCQSNQWILVGWSHYGTKKFQQNNSTSKFNEQRCEPSETDCIMDYTHKIAELCNGVSKCEVILTQQFIHKCTDEATYLFISYQCVDNSTIVDICSERTQTSSTGLNLISPTFPNEYPNNVNCSCTIQSNERSPTIMIDVESFSFNLQDNDHLASLSGTSPFGASLLTGQNRLDLRFQTDETLTQSGFWIRLHGFRSCHNDEFNLGLKCIKIFSKKQTWKSAEEQCLALNSNLIHLYDVIQEKKFAHFLSIHQEHNQPSFWISHTHDIHSWWPWRTSVEQGQCIVRNHDGWVKRPCQEEHAFICERNVNLLSIPLTMRCGQSSTSDSPVNLITKTITSTSSSSVIRPIILKENIFSSNNEQNLVVTSSIVNRIERTSRNTRMNIIDPNILAAILGGVAIAVFSMNLIVCYLCKRRSQNPSKCKTPNESQSSLTHEELQRSLMHHLYHEQMNTISSTSTSSSASKQSQSKSNETTISNVQLQLISPICHSSQSYSTHPTTLTRNSHPMSMINTEPTDYHVYETIPTENAAYTLCTAHSAFKPVLQSNTHTIRPYLSKHNVLYPATPYDLPTTNLTSSTVLIPACCYHSMQNSTATFKSQILSNKKEQNYIGSESIV